MTKEEIFQMEPGLELDQLVAERVMRWSKATRTVSTGSVFQSVEFWEEAGRITHPVRVWSPSTNPQHALEVVEKTKQNKGWVWVASCGIGPEGRWRVIVYNYESYMVEASTFPLAVCRAALLAVEEGEQL